jgi:hypothetical protein
MEQNNCHIKENFTKRPPLPPCSVLDPDIDFSPVPDPGSRGQKGTGSRIRNTEL